MRIVAISDTHLKHNDLDVPDGDILIHAGDSTKRGQLEQIESVNYWLGTLPHKHKIIIAGNHDFGLQVDSKWFESRTVVTLVVVTDCEGLATVLDRGRKPPTSDTGLPVTGR